MGAEGGHCRVIHVTCDDPTRYSSGKTRSTLTLVDHLAERGVPVVVVAPGRGPVTWLVRLAARTVALLHRPLGEVFHQRAVSLLLRRRLAEEVRAAEASGREYVVHARDPMSLLAFERLRPPGTLARTVLTLHVLGSHADEMILEGTLKARGPLRRYVRDRGDRAVRAADVVVATSRCGRGRLLSATPGLEPSRVTVIPNPIEVTPAHVPVSRAALGIPEDAFVVFVAARMKAIKRLDLMLEVADTVASRVPHFRLVIAGEGPEMRSLRCTIHALGLDRTVLLLGTRADVPDIMALSDVVALSSVSESFGRSLAEGAAVGRPRVAFDVGALSEIVIDGRTGYLVPFGDVAAFATRLVRLAEDPALALRMGMEAQRHAVFCSPEVVTDAYLRTYCDLCEHRGDRPTPSEPVTARRLLG